MMAMSPMLKSLILGLGTDSSNIETCLILPELKKLEFMTFHRALFAGENDTNLDFFVLIKVAEILGCELVIKQQFALKLFLDARSVFFSFT